MKVLVATTETQGQWGKLDFAFVPEGELVGFGMECDGDERWNGRCGCRRSMVGMERLKATTSFKVEERRDLNLLGLEAAVEESLRKGGWLELGTDDDNAKWVRGNAAELARLASLYPAGTVLGKRGNRFVVRRHTDHEAVRILTGEHNTAPETTGIAAREPKSEARPKLKLVGTDGNAFAVLGAALKAARKAGWSKEQMGAFQAEATSGDYNALLATCQKWFDVE